MGKIDLLKEQAQDPRHDQSAFKSAFDGNYVPLMGSQPYVDENQDIDYKFNEDNIINELKEHIDKTYDSHYSKEKFQATEFIVDGGHGTGFCIGNILKYAQRYGKKGKPSDARRDLMKILHYAVIQLHVHDKENDSEDL